MTQAPQLPYKGEPLRSTRTSQKFVSESYALGCVMGAEDVEYTHRVYGTAWDVMPTAVDRSYLIKAAPALLEAARKLLSVMRSNKEGQRLAALGASVMVGDEQEAEAKLDAAIRQATGEEQTAGDPGE